MRQILVVALLVSVFMPSMAMAQGQPTCEQRLAIMDQIVESMSRARATVSTAEVEAASLKVQVKALRDEIEAGKKEANKNAPVQPTK